MMTLQGMNRVGSLVEAQVDRETLIARKQTVRQQIERHQRRLEQLRQTQPLDVRRIRTLEAELERLMSEEYTLRLAIDQHRIT